MSATRCPHCGELHDTTGCPTYPKGISGPVPMTLAPTVYWHDPEPVGSPAYVRRLRDQAALRILQAMYSNPEMDRFGFGGYVQPEDMAVKDANKLVAVLGYQIPEDGEATS